MKLITLHRLVESLMRMYTWFFSIFLHVVVLVFSRGIIYLYPELLRCIIFVNEQHPYRRVRKMTKSNSKLRRICLVACPSSWNNSAPTERIFMKFDI
jgi:hypothetical protein